MKKSLAILLSAVSFSVLADPQFNNITKKDVENVSAEFGANFAHTVVAAPETNGLWGVEIGFVGGQTGTPDFKKVVDNSGGDGKDFKNVYHAAIMARAHFPFELFAELSYLPEQEISDVKIKSNSFGVGWNAGSFFNLPLDVAIGLDFSNGDLNFFQKGNGTTVPEANIDLKTKTQVYWLGVSKTFAFFTPYAKIGKSNIDGDLKADANIFNISGQTKESVSMNGGFFAVGANFQLFFLRLGVEASQIQEVKRVSGKLSFSF